MAVVDTTVVGTALLRSRFAMSTISAGGIGSGLDVASIVQQLVAAERAPTDGRLDRTDRQLQAQISAIGALRSAFSTLRTSVTALSSTDNTQARKGTLPEGAGFTAATSAGAAVGRYQVEVIALASAHKLSSAAYADNDTVVGTGRLTISSGDITLDVDLDGTSNTLIAVRDAINAKAAGKGVAATIVQADDGAHLVLNALSTGSANAIRVTTSGGDGGLAALVYDPPTTTNLTQLDEALDSKVKVDTFERTSPTNTVSDLISGVTLTLTKAEVGTVREFTVASDPVAQRNAAKAFVNAYNASIGAIANTTSYNATTKVAAALNGDALVRGASSDLRNQVSAQVTDLKAVGISINKDGTLKMDDAAFDAAMAADASPATRLFVGPDSLATGLKTSLDLLLNDDGLLDGRSDGLDRRTKTLANQRTELDRRMTQVEARYRAQFVALDGLVAKLQSTGNFLTQQLGLLGG
jgi:flagellar hook-associated protein 2